MNCNCEYDSFIADGGVFNFECELNGNYATHQYAGDKPYCVDSDGYQMVCPPNSGKTSQRRKPLHQSG